MNLCNKIEEHFKPIKGYEELYEVSNLGMVKNIKFNKILKPVTDSDGYYVVGLHGHNKRSIKKIHRLVAIAFIPNLENKPQVNHINAIKNDNRIVNLEWATAKENVNHAEMMGLYKLKRIADSKRLSRQTLDLYTGIIFDSLKIACESLNLNYSTQTVYIGKKINNRLQYV